METSLLTTPTLYTSYIDRDIKDIVKYLNENFNRPNLYTAGISMGAGVVAKQAGTFGEKWPFKAQVCMSVPYDLKLCVRALETPGYEVHNLIMTQSLQENVLNNYDYLETVEEQCGFDLKETLAAKRITDFDKHFMVPINGFRNQEAFYDDTSAGFVIQNIKIPTLFIHSLDDPICVKETIPFVKIHNNHNCILVLTKKGGHVEWFSGQKRPERWAYKPAIEFLVYQAKLNGDM